MSLLSLFERRSGLANPAAWMVDAFGGGASKAGVRVSPDSAMQLSAVFACVQVRAQTLAALPLKLIERSKAGDKIPAVAHPLYRILSVSPHPQLTRFEFIEMMSGHLDLRGNAYAQIVRNGAGDIVRLVPLHPDRVTVRRSPKFAADGTRPLLYDVTNPGFEGGQATLTEFEMLHLRELSGDGVLGYSRIKLACDTLGLALAADEHAGRMFANGARPAGVLEHPGKLGDAGAKNLRDSWQAIHGGVANTGKVAILEEGLKFHEIGLSNEDAQLLQTRKFSRSEIASIFRVPPHKIGDLEKATFSNIEQQSIEFVQDCMLPTCVRWEQRLGLSLLSVEEQARYFAQFNLAGLLRGDMKSRYEAFAIGRTNGWLSANEIREVEDMNRIKGGDTYLTPLNMTAQTARSALEPLLTDALARAFRKEAKALRAISKKPTAEAAPEIDRFYAEHQRYLLEILAPLATAARHLGVDTLHPDAITAQVISDSTEALRVNAGANVESILVVWESSRASATAASLLTA